MNFEELLNEISYDLGYFHVYSTSKRVNRRIYLATRLRLIAEIIKIAHLDKNKIIDIINVFLEVLKDPSNFIHTPENPMKFAPKVLPKLENIHGYNFAKRGNFIDAMRQLYKTVEYTGRFLDSKDLKEIFLIFENNHNYTNLALHRQDVVRHMSLDDAIAYCAIILRDIEIKLIEFEEKNKMK